MVDLQGQYQNMKDEMDQAILEVLASAQFIKGPQHKIFEQELADYLGTQNLITCANGTDALQIALMALDLKQGDEVIVPAFSYIATVEVIALLGLTPIFADVNLDDFSIDTSKVGSLITSRTKVIIPVHLFGQQADVKSLKRIAEHHDIKIIEDNAQSLGSINLNTKNKNLLGHIATTSFYPSKNLSCYGDGGAIYCDDHNLADRIRQIANHGQSEKYIHDTIGVNSRLDSLQAAVLSIKLKYLDQYIQKRQQAAEFYYNRLEDNDLLILPTRDKHSKHIFHQFTLRILNGKRDELRMFLKSKSIPTMLYYPLPMYRQKAYHHYVAADFKLPNSEMLCEQVLSIPIHTELDENQMEYIVDNINLFFNK